uniref:Uncharacterized protein n=1 Tax=Ignisphaera aggregans TaxID=334771 RepID=A0A7J2U3S8_9CREN
MRSVLEFVKERNKRMKSDVVETPLDLLRLLNKRWRSTRIETPLDMLRILNREKRVQEVTEKLLERVRGER